MALVSAGFVVFCCAACLVNYLLPVRLRYLWLLVCSYAMYIYTCRGKALQMPERLAALGLGEALPAWLPAVSLLVLATAASWLCGLLIARFSRKALRVAFLCLGVGSCLALWVGCRNLGLLGIFRLHVGGIVTGESATGFTSIALPLGLSYYTIQAAGYVLDVFAGRAKTERNPLRYALFVSFFPAIFLGPTARAAHLMPQLASPARFDYDGVTGGLFRMLWGFFKKLVVADNLAAFTGFILTGTAYFDAPLLVTAILLFPVQLYMDFSGCCDIVLGAARMLGIRHDENFFKPFAAATFAALWRRWFISLSGLLRDAILIPLTNAPFVKNRTALGRCAIVAGSLLTYLALGAWHGFAADYLLWGLATGALVAGSLLLDPVRNRMAEAVPLYRAKPVRAVWRRVAVYLLFAASLTLFISAYYQQPFTQWVGNLGKGWALLTSGAFLPSLAEAGLTTRRMAIVGGGLALVGLLEHFAVSFESTVADWVRTRRFFVRWPLYYLLIAGLLFFGVFPASSGIYQGF